MGDKNRFSKPVAFNNKNEKDQAILKHVSRRNFSGYVKKLILEDMKAKAQIGIVEPLGESNEQTHAEVVETPLVVVQKPETPQEQRERLIRDAEERARQSNQQKH